MSQKFKWLLIIQIACLLLILPACFMQEKEIYWLTGEAMNYGEQGVPFVGGQLELTPGVYQVRVTDAYCGFTSSMYLLENISYRA